MHQKVHGDNGMHGQTWYEDIKKTLFVYRWWMGSLKGWNKMRASKLWVLIFLGGELKPFKEFYYFIYANIVWLIIKIEKKNNEKYDKTKPELIMPLWPLCKFRNKEMH